jgi:MFS family permease
MLRHMGTSVDSPLTDSGVLARAAVYVVVLSAAYYYTLTFVQLGVTEVAMERLGLSMELVAVAMGLLAAVTLVVTLGSGWAMDRFGWGRTLQHKFRLLFGLLLLQVGVTVALTAVSSFTGLLLWIVSCSVPLGVAIPFAFSLLLDLVAPAWRGYAAGAVAGCAFLLAVFLPFEWTVGSFVPAAVTVLAPVVLLLGVLSVSPGVLGAGVTRAVGVDQSQFDQHGRVELLDVLTVPALVGLVLLFGAFFVDSLGFVRIVETPAYVDSSWQSPDYGTRLAIGGTHVAGGLAAGFVYARAGSLWLFAASFALFGTAQCLYVYDIVAGGPAALGLGTPLVYVLAVSCYTTVTFALWPDLATRATVGRYTAVGVGVGGWLATFTSTGLALLSDRRGLALELHLLVAGSVSVGFLALTASLWYLTAVPTKQPPRLRR